MFCRPEIKSKNSYSSLKWCLTAVPVNDGGQDEQSQDLFNLCDIFKYSIQLHLVQYEANPRDTLKASIRNVHAKKNQNHQYGEAHGSRKCLLWFRKILHTSRHALSLPISGPWHPFSRSLFSKQFINCINIAAIIGGRNVCCSNGALINSIVIIIIIAVHVVAVLARLWRCSLVAACCCWTERKIWKSPSLESTTHPFSPFGWVGPQRSCCIENVFAFSASGRPIISCNASPFTGWNGIFKHFSNILKYRFVWPVWSCRFFCCCIFCCCFEWNENWRIFMWQTTTHNATERCWVVIFHG